LAWIRSSPCLFPSPEPCDFAALDGTAMLFVGHHVAISWHGCVLVGDSVDHRQRPRTWPSSGASPRRWCSSDDVDVARQHARGVCDGLAAPDLRVCGCPSRIVWPPSSRMPTSNDTRVVPTASRRSWRASCRRAAFRAPVDRAFSRLAAMWIWQAFSIEPIEVEECLWFRLTLPAALLAPLSCRLERLCGLAHMSMPSSSAAWSAITPGRRGSRFAGRRHQQPEITAGG